MKKLDLKTGLREWLWIAFTVGVIFLFLIGFLLALAPKNPLILSICTVGYAIPIISLVGFVKNYYSKDIFLNIYETIANPIISLIALTFLSYLFYYSFGADIFILPIMGVVFFCAFLTSFFAVASLYFLRKEEHQFLTVRAFHTAKKFLKWNAILFVLFTILSFITFYVSIGYSPILPIADYATVMAWYFFLLTFAMIGINFLSYNDIRKYCKLGLNIVKEGLSPPRQVGREWVERRLSVFQTVIDQFSGLAKKFYPSSPRISESYPHCKALYAAYYAAHHASDSIGRKNFLKNAKRGIKKMTDSLKAGKSKKSFDFYLFVGGLVLIDRGKGTRDVENEFREVQQAFETPNLTNNLKRYWWLISFVVTSVITLIHILITR